MKPQTNNEMTNKAETMTTTKSWFFGKTIKMCKLQTRVIKGKKKANNNLHNRLKEKNHITISIDPGKGLAIHKSTPVPDDSSYLTKNIRQLS